MIWEEEGLILLDGELEMGIMSKGYAALKAEYGTLVLNRLTVRAEPRRVDTLPQVVASMPNAVEVKAGQSIIINLPYVDMLGRARQVSVVTDAMETPNPNGTVDPYLVTLLNFEGSVTDETGRHTWTQNDVSIEATIYKDGYGTTWCSNIMGNFAVFGGYSNYKMTTPAGADFNFGSGAFSIDFYFNLFDAMNNARAILASQESGICGFLIGYKSGEYLYVYMSSNGSSWDIANGKLIGHINAGKWTHYVFSRDENGWFYIGTDGKEVARWYSPLPLLASSGNIVVGYWNGNYMYMGLDMLRIYKGKTWYHGGDYEVPKIKPTIYLDEDYWGNTAKDRTGTDITASIFITPTCGTDAAQVKIDNIGAVDGFVKVQLRGIGIYFDGTQEASVHDDDSIAANGYIEATVNQKYQYSTAPGLKKITDILANRKTARMDLLSVQFVANESHYYMMTALYLDIGSLIRVANDRVGIDGYYYIQARELKIEEGNIIHCTLYLTQDFLHD